MEGEEIGIASIIGTILISGIVGLITCMICGIQQGPQEPNEEENFQNLQYRSDIPIALAANPEDLLEDNPPVPQEPQEFNLKPTSSEMKKIDLNDFTFEKVKYTKPFVREDYTQKKNMIQIIQINSKQVRENEWELSGLRVYEERSRYQNLQSDFQSSSLAKRRRLKAEMLNKKKQRRQRYTDNPLKIYPYAPAILLQDEKSSPLRVTKSKKLKSIQSQSSSNSM